MGYFLLAYATDGYQEFVLPELVDVNYRISLEGQKFGLKRDLTVLLENVDDRWSFVESEKYRLFTYEGKNAFGCSLEDGMVVQVKTDAGVKITLMSFYSVYSYPVYDKYFIGGLSQISIGKENSNSRRKRN